MYALSLLQGMVFYAPIATLYRTSQGVSVFEITILESVSLVLCLALEVPWGMAADRIGYKKTMAFCCGLYFASKLVFWAAEGFWCFMLERVMLAVVMAGISGVDMSVIYLSCGGEKGRRVFSLYNILGTLGMLSAALIFSRFVGENYKLAAALTAVSYGLAFIISLFLVEVRGENQSKFCLAELKKLIKNVLHNRRLLMLLAAIALFSESCHTVTVFLNQPKYESCGMSASAIGLAYALVTLSGVLAALSDSIVKKFGEKRSSVMLGIVALASCIILSLTGSGLVSVCGVLLMNIAMSIFEPMQLEMQSRAVRSANRATELSVYAIIVDCISAGSSLVYGALAEMSLKAAFAFGGAVCFVGVLLLINSRDKTHKAKE